ncbi:peptidylprolyl isomerase [Sunxiuqinia elliptica]|uniref:Peptidyl-prolyl cis-trans isomerase n=1 Tax=Sunxiuqinia elliptica TaxID=655355 RepID=A0A1I2D459_9BACT|nr:peptidylprolyl isomerase [Sunxiuqinia elliptica]SFE75347.1 peptidyl-prolyl cis-trans isomerase A (cyclophilin A) [Sunxiuqinia elliptica]
MKLIGSLLVLLTLFSCQSPKKPQVQIVTNVGTIMLELYPEKAPVTVENFLQLVDENAYENASFYRVVRMDNQPVNPVKIEVIQGGLQDDQLVETYETIKHETTNETGVKHLDGVISMARNEPGSASTEFFICIGDQPELDFGGKRNPDGQGFAAFGVVTDGVDVVRQIQHGKAAGQSLETSVMIERIERVN